MLFRSIRSEYNIYKSKQQKAFKQTTKIGCNCANCPNQNIMVSQKKKKKKRVKLQSTMFSNSLNFIIKNCKKLERREMRTSYVLEIQGFIYWREFLFSKKKKYSVDDISA